MNDKIEFWDCCEEVEILTWTERDEAIEMHLDDRPRDEWPETLTVYGFARETPNWQRHAKRVLENLIEDLDEPYGNPEEATAITPAMEQASTEFVNRIKAEYRVWSCKKVTSEEINVMEWVKENNPEWLATP